MDGGRTFAVIAGASSGIGLELARCAAADGSDLLLVADEPEVLDVAEAFRKDGHACEAIVADLGTEAGLDKLWGAIGDRVIDELMANAGHGLGGAFLVQDWDGLEDVVHVNVTGTTALLHRAIPEMMAAGSGRILITGSIAGLVPGSHQAVYNATKAYLDTLSWALREELRDSGVTVTCLMPGPTDTEFFERARMQDTPVGQRDDKDDPAMVAHEGYKAMKRGRSGVTPGFVNKVKAAFAGVLPDSVLARMQRDVYEPEETSSD